MKKMLSLLCLLIYSNSYAQDPCGRRGTPYSSLPGDTTITLKNGSQITFNRCEFFDLRDCIEIVEISNVEDLRREGLTMYDGNGNILLTCGMIKFDMSKCGKKCFEVPVRFKLKIRFQNCADSANAVPGLYFNSGSGWEKPDKNYKITTTNSERYLEFETTCPPAFINCDLPKKGRKVKFVAPKKMKISELRLGISCPLYYYDTNPGNPKRRIKVKMLCQNPENIMIQSMLIRRSGDSILIPMKKLADLNHGKRRIDCKKPRRPFFKNLFGWIFSSKGILHRKYFISNS